MEQLVVRLRQFWSSLNPVQKGIVTGVPALLIVGALAAITLAISAPPVKAPLYRNLEVADAGRIVEELQKQRIEYELENDGRDILVPAEEVYDLRLQLAAAGLPRDKVGFELFDKRDLGITESETQIKMQRALQGELARTLEALDQVTSATVLLNIAPETSFLDSDSRSTASVALTLGAGQPLSKAQVDGVRRLVSNAVPRLDPEDVSIVDGAGNPLNGAEDVANAEQLAGLAATDLQARFRTRVERDLEDKIRKVLEGPYGSGKVSPSVTVEVDFRAIHNESETYTPVVDDQGIEQRVEEHRESSTGATETPGGVPGTTSNIPGYLGISGSEQQATEQSKYDLIVDYLVNKQVSLEDLPPGTVTRRSAAVALSTSTWDETVKANVEQLVATAIGADVTRGDSIMVQAFEFSAADESTVTQEYMRQQGARNFSKIAGWVVALLMVGLLMLLVRSVIGSALPREELALAAVGGAKRSEGFEVTEAGDEYPLRKLTDIGTSQQERMRHEISRMIDKNPGQVMALVRTWMLEDT